MSAQKEIFCLENPEDVEMIRNIILCNTSDVEPPFDDSDTDSIDFVHEREEDSATEQSMDDSEDDETSENIHLGKDKTTKWKHEPPSKFAKKRPHNVLSKLPNVKGEARNANTIFDSWLCLLSENILEIIVRETNRKIDTLKSNYDRERDAKNTDIIEIKAVLGLLYLAGVRKCCKLSLEELWANDNTGIEHFRLTMTSKRFRFLLQNLRFDNLATREIRKTCDKLAPIRDIVDIFVSNCIASYSVGQNVTIDEMLPGFRGRCSFRQYIPTKPNRYGIKMFGVVDSRMHYLLNLEIYVGEQPDGIYRVSNSPKDLVLRLSQPIHNTGRNIVADNWFTSIPLIDELVKKRLSYVGTMKRNKRELPLSFSSLSRRPLYSSIFGFKENITITSYMTKKNKCVILASSMHYDAKIDSKTLDKKKPEMVTYYNEHKGGVDILDEMMEAYNVARATRRWPMVIFYTLLNIAAINSYVIYVTNNRTKMSRKDYLKELALTLTHDEISRRSNKTRGIPLALQDKLQPFRQQLDSPEPDESDEGPNTSAKTACGPCKYVKRKRYSRYACYKCKTHLCIKDHAKFVCEKCLCCCKK